MRHRRIGPGILTPLSNMALDPMTSAVLSERPHMSTHFARFTITEIALSEQALGQFDASRILAAARQPSDARVDVIDWSGMSAAWLGCERDQVVCCPITEATGIPVAT